MERSIIEKSVIEAIQANCQFNKDNIDPDSDLRDNYGIDSIAIVNVLIDMEGLFGITIDSNVLTYDHFSTIKKIADHIEGLLAGN